MRLQIEKAVSSGPSQITSEPSNGSRHCQAAAIFFGLAHCVTMAARRMHSVLAVPLVALALAVVVSCFLGHASQRDAFVSPPTVKKVTSKGIDQDSYTAALVMGATGLLASPAPVLAQARGENDDAENSTFFLALWPTIAIFAYFRVAAEYLGWGKKEAPSAFGIAVDAPEA